MSNKIRKESLEVILKSLITDAHSVRDMHLYLEKTKSTFNALYLFSLSEITHRKVLDLKYKLTNPFFYGKSKKEFRTMLFELEDLDTFASQSTTNLDTVNVEVRYVHI